MKCFRIHLWREWNQHRKAVLLLSLGIVFAVLLISWIVPRRLLPPIDALVWCSLFSALAFGMSVGADLFAAGRQNGTNEFLRRTPGGIRVTFFAKLLVYFLMILSAASLGGVLSFVLQSRLGNGPVAGSFFGNWTTWDWVWGSLFCLCVLTWGFAVSTWVKNGALTLPTTMLFLGAAMAPGYVMSERAYGGFRVDPMVAGTLVLSTLGAILCAYVSFVMGNRKGDRTRRATFASVLLACLIFTPSWVSAGQKYLERVRPLDYVASLVVGQDQRFAFLNINRRRNHPWEAKNFETKSAVLLDLSLGRASLAGEAQESMWGSGQLAGSVRGPIWDSNGEPFVTLNQGLPLSHPSLTPASEPIVYGGRSGRVFEGSVSAAASEIWNAWEWPKELHFAIGEGRVFRSGTGFMLQRLNDPSGERDFWDPAGKLLVGKGRSDSFFDLFDQVIVLPGRWLRRDDSETWSLVDPKTGSTEELSCIPAGDRQNAVIADGSLLFLREGRVDRVWPETGLSSAVELLGFESHSGSISKLWSRLGLFPTSKNGVFAVELGSPAKEMGAAVFDPLANTLELIATEPKSFYSGLCMLAAGDGYGVFLEDAGQVYWVDAEAVEMRLIFDLETAELGLDR